MKKFLALLLVLALLCPAAAFAEETPEEYESGDYKYVLAEDGSAVITDYLGSGSSIAIPAELDGHPVTGIGDSAFFRCSVTEVTIPERVTSIGKQTFRLCSALKEIVIPDSVTYIGDDAFAGCESLTEITIPNGVTFIGLNAFSGCYLLTAVTLPASIPDFNLSAAFGGYSGITFTVPRDSEMAQLCEEAGAHYTYPDTNDWLYN